MLTAAKPLGRFFGKLLSVTVLATSSVVAAPSSKPAALTFEQDIRPILKANCFHCHGEEDKVKGGLDVRLRHLLAKGGEHGPAIVPGKPEKSRLFTMVRDGEMPQSDKKLSPRRSRSSASGSPAARRSPARSRRSRALPMTSRWRNGRTGRFSR